MLNLLYFFLFITGPIFGSEPFCEFTTKSVGKGSALGYIFAPFGETNEGLPGLVELDSSGSCIRQKPLGYDVADFKPHVIGADLYFSYLKVEEVPGEMGVNGVRVVLDKNWNLVKTIRMSQPSAFGRVQMDSHDFLLFDLDHFTALHYVPYEDWLGRCYILPEISEMKDGELKFSWSPNILELGKNAWSAEEIIYRGRACRDVYHLNSIQKTTQPEGYLVSLGGLGSVRFIPRSSIIKPWVLGGPLDEFELPEQYHFEYQHTASWDEASQTLLLFDNGITKNKFRVLEFNLDVDERKIISAQTLYSGSQRSKNMGSVWRCGPDCILIGAGNTSGPDIIEIDLKTKKRFEVHFQNGPNRYKTYRIYSRPTGKDPRSG